MNINQNIGFLRGLLENMDAETKRSTEGKLFSGIVRVLTDMNQHADKMDEMLSELNDYVESIDDDLSELEEEDGKKMPFPLPDDEDDEDYEFEDDEDDDDDDDDDDDAEEVLHLVNPCDDGERAAEIVGGICPECKWLFFVDVDETRDYACPHCGKVVKQIPLTPDNIPMAKPIE